MPQMRGDIGPGDMQKAASVIATPLTATAGSAVFDAFGIIY